MAVAGDCDHRIHSCRYSGRCASCHRLHLRRRFVQAGRRITLRRRHCHQERLGLRILRVHHPMDHQIGLYPAHHDERLSRSIVVFVRYRLLEVWKDFPKVVSELECS